jgi:phosphoribosylaminoimidazolecarboxamide formyltransferase/IMP cyclohydrolase
MDAYTKAYQVDPTSIFGGIVAVNRKLTADVARELVKIFLEVVAAPEFEPEALTILKTKKNLRVLKFHKTPQNKHTLVSVDGGLLIQSEDNKFIESLDVVTKKQITKEQEKDLLFAMKVVK